MENFSGCQGACEQRSAGVTAHFSLRGRCMKTELGHHLGQHGFFPELVRMVTAISGVALALEAFSAGRWRGSSGTRSFRISSGMSMQWSRVGARND
jgi:hypothetical protein